MQHAPPDNFPITIYILGFRVIHGGVSYSTIVSSHCMSFVVVDVCLDGIFKLMKWFLDGGTGLQSSVS